ncbi:MAG: cyclic nucleotide-binding domain-containing protein [Pseudomonadota bacterium]
MTSSEKENNATVESEFLYTLNKFRQTGFFANLPQEAVKVIAFLCTREAYKAGDVIFHRNEDDGCAYYLTRGTASLVLATGTGDQVMKTLEKDSFIGILALLTSMPRKFSLIADTEVEFLIMTRKKFARVLDQYPEIMLKLIASLGEKINEAEKNLIHHVESRSRDGANLLGISLI